MKAGDQIALLDLDGTVADYDRRFAQYMEEIRHPDEPPFPGRYNSEEKEPPFMEARRKLIQGYPGFWRNLSRIQMGYTVVNMLRELGFVIHVLTKGPMSTVGAWTEKVEWCKAHLPDAFVNISSDKSLMYGKVLVDDYPAYFEAWRDQRPRGLVVCVAQPWNREYEVGEAKETPNVFRYNGSNHELLWERLTHAYNRKNGEA